MSDLIKVFCPKGEMFELRGNIAKRMVTVLGWSYDDDTIKTQEPTLEDILEVKSPTELRRVAKQEFGVILPTRHSKARLIEELTKLHSMSEGRGETKEESGDEEDSYSSDDKPTRQ